MGKITTSSVKQAMVWIETVRKFSALSGISDRKNRSVNLQDSFFNATFSLHNGFLNIKVWPEMRDDDDEVPLPTKVFLMCRW